MWPSVNGNVLTNQIDIRSEKTHEVTRCKQALRSIRKSKGRSVHSETAHCHLRHMHGHACMLSHQSPKRGISMGEPDQS